MCFGLSTLSSEEFVNDWFTNDSMSIKPINDRIEEFFDYTYYLINWMNIEKDGTFLQTMWSKYKSILEGPLIAVSHFIENSTIVSIPPILKSFKLSTC